MFTVFRPAALLCKDGRKESRLGEKVLLGIMKPIIAISPTSLSVPVESVAKSMIINLFTREEGKEGTEIIENAKLHEMAKTFDGQFE